MSDPKAWTPDMPLRADATDEQMTQRLYALPSGMPTYRYAVDVAREYAAACVAAATPPVVRWEDSEDVKAARDDLCVLWSADLDGVRGEIDAPTKLLDALCNAVAAACSTPTKENGGTDAK